MAQLDQRRSREMDTSNVYETWRALHQSRRKNPGDRSTVSPANGKNHVLSIRRRGKNGIHYIQGTVALGGKCIVVKEFCSGASNANAASHLMANHETKLRHQLMFGPAALVAQGTIAEAFDSYLTKAKPPCASDVLRIGKLN